MCAAAHPPHEKGRKKPMDIASVDPMITFLIATRNRREVLLRTLDELQEVDWQSGLITETIVVDNASRDGTAAAVASQFPQVQLLAERKNRGACAKNAGLAKARGEFVIFLDDDSYPTAAGVRRMVQHFFAEPDLGAAIFDVTLPDGSHESSAYPSVVIGCGSGFRRSALLKAGGLPADFFMQAEEYDLSLRLLESKWKIRRFDDLQIHHLKTPTARIPTRTTRLDMRNNVMVVTRYFPRHWMLPFAIDWARRYWWMAGTKSRRHQIAAAVGMIQGVLRSLRPGHRRPVGLAAFETFAMPVAIRQRLGDAIRTHRLHSIVLIDLGKNILPFVLAAKAIGVHVRAIADSRLAATHRTYRGIPVVSDEQASLMIFDAAVVANLSPAHAGARADQWRRQGRMVIDLFETAELLSIAA
jgi:GT2 family glycosyltransferase